MSSTDKLTATMSGLTLQVNVMPQVVLFVKLSLVIMGILGANITIPIILPDVQFKVGLKTVATLPYRRTGCSCLSCLPLLIVPVFVVVRQIGYLRVFNVWM